MALVIIATGVFYYYPPVTFWEKDFASSSQVIFVFFVIILAITVYSFVMIHKHLNKKVKTIDEIMSSINRIKGKNIENEFNNLKNSFKDTFLEKSWNKYEKSLRRIKSGVNDYGEIQEKLYATVEAEYYFDGKILTNDSPYRLQTYFPHMLVSIGILGTFLGIVMGLERIDLENIETTKKSIDVLLSGVQVSFRTSLYGITYSILLTLYQKIYKSLAEEKLYNLAEEINPLFPTNTQEDGIKEIYLELEKQTSAIQRLASDFAEEIGNKFNASLQENLAPTLVKLTETTENLARIAQETNSNALRALVDNVGDVITSAANKELNTLKTTLFELNNKNLETFEKFNTAVTSIGNLIESHKNVIQETNTSALNINKANREILDVSEKFHHLINSFENFYANQLTLNQNNYELIDKYRESIFSQKELSGLIQENQKASVELIKLQAELINKTSDTAQNLNWFVQKMEGMLSKLNENIVNFEKASESINNNFLEIIENIDSDYTKMRLSLKEMSAALDQTMDRLSSEVFSNLEQINREYTKIVSSLELFGINMEEFTEKLSEYSKAQESVQSLWRSYKDSFEKLNQNMEKGIVDYTNNVRHGLDSIFKQYDEHITRVLDNFNNTIDSFSMQLEELNDMIDEKLKTA